MKAESSIKEVEQVYKGQHKRLSAVLLSVLPHVPWGDGGKYH